MNIIMTTKLALLEAVLFTTTKPLSIEELQKIIRIKKESIEKLIQQLREKYNTEESGIHLSEAGGYRLSVKPHFNENVSNLTPHADLSRGLLRVLSIIAYHEPIKQSDIVKVIGNRTYEYIKELDSRGLIRVEKKSRTRILSTTPQFEEYFGTKKEDLKKIVEESKSKEPEEEL